MRMPRSWESGCWLAFDHILGWINSQDEQLIDKKTLYHAVFEMRPHLMLREETNMGWCSGSSVAGPLIEVLKVEVSSTLARERIYEVLLNTLISQDWDTVDECLGIDEHFDLVVSRNYPEWDLGVDGE